MSTPETQPRQSYRQGQALKDALAALNRAPQRPSVTISRDADGNYAWDLRVPADTLTEAHEEAQAIAALLDALYPVGEADPERHKVKFTRNAAGVTQIEMEGRYADDELEQAFQRFETARARYPLKDGTVSADAPRPAAKR